MSIEAGIGRWALREMFHWHSMLMAGNRYIETIGAYRDHEDAMQIVSGRLDKTTIHFEAPHLARFKLKWRTSSHGSINQGQMAKRRFKL
jgi:Fic family protein